MVRDWMQAWLGLSVSCVWRITITLNFDSFCSRETGPISSRRTLIKCYLGDGLVA